MVMVMGFQTLRWSQGLLAFLVESGLCIIHIGESSGRFQVSIVNNDGIWSAPLKKCNLPSVLTK